MINIASTDATARCHGSGGKAQGRSRFVPMQVSAGVHGDDLTGSHTSSRVDLTGETLKMINVPKAPHRFTGKKEDDGMHRSKDLANSDWLT